MTIDEHNALIQKIMDNVGDQAVISECLTTFRNDYAETTKDFTETKSAKELLEKNLEDLRVVNNSLMRQGAKLVEIQQLPNDKNKNVDEGDNENELNYDDLFDEKGGLK